MGLFTPIWMTDKKEKVPRAVAAVEKVTDPERLRTIATSANFGDIPCGEKTRGRYNRSGYSGRNS